MKRFWLIITGLAIIALWWLYFGPKHYQVMHGADQISAVYVVRTDGDVEESAEVSLSIVQDIMRLRVYTYSPPHAHLTAPYIRIVYSDGVEEWISKEGTFIVTNGKQTERIWGAHFLDEDFRKMIEPYMDVFLEETA